MGIDFYFGIKGNSIHLYARINKSEGYASKSLKHFWGDSYRLKTNVEFWDDNRKIRQFKTKYKGVPIPTAEKDNKRLKQLAEQITTFEYPEHCTSIQQWFDYFKVAQNVISSKPITLLEFARIHYNKWKNNEYSNFTEPSTNYQIYEKLIHKLEGTCRGKKQEWYNEAQRFANMPISAINSEVYREWAQFIVKYNLGFRDSVNAFRAVVYAYQRGLMNNEEFKLAKVDKLKPQQQPTTTDMTLGVEQLEDLKTFDLNTIMPRTKNKEMHRDVLLLLYYLCSRPVDILTMRVEDIKTVDGVCVWDYRACKLCNESSKAYVYVNEEAQEIINKYKGSRKKGFLFTYKCTTYTDWQNIKKHANKDESPINRLLQAIAIKCNWKFKPIMYTMRKTGITALVSSGMSFELAANQAKTSDRELKRVYVDKNAIAIQSATAINNAFKSL